MFLFLICISGNKKMLSIVQVENPNEEDHGFIYHGMNEYAATYGMNGTGGFFFAAYDETKQIISAISGFDNFGPADIGGLFVSEKYRGQGYGKKLVSMAEDWAKEKGCPAITVFTIKDWPAFEFYQKLGFNIEYERPGHAKGCVGCYLIKKF